jgi:hypothetical protein
MNEATMLETKELRVGTTLKAPMEMLEWRTQ